jgi:hypothetical protein
MITEGFEPPSSCTSRRRSTAELRDLKRADGRDRTGVLLAGNEALYRQSFIRMAGMPGFEPGSTGLEPVMLTVTPHPYGVTGRS